MHNDEEASQPELFGRKEEGIEAENVFGEPRATNCDASPF
jgi:hypothetical protein